MHDTVKPIVLCILGPTAAGKTEVALSVAKSFGAEVVSADSMQIYNELHIGTARPLPSELGDIPHHLMGFLKPDEKYNVAMYQHDAKKEIENILKRGNYPLIAGGTGLYLNALRYNIDFSATPDHQLREKIGVAYDLFGAEAMYEKLLKLDPSSAERIHKNDKKRIVRRLEILEGASGSDSVETYNFRKPQEAYTFITVGINKERAQLYTDINTRVDQMIQAGLLQEVQNIYQKYGPHITAFTAIGYKEFLPYFEGNTDMETVIAKIKQDTRRFAKRQLTWFNKEPDVHWFYADAFKNKTDLNHAVTTYITSQIEEKKNADNT